MTQARREHHAACLHLAKVLQKTFRAKQGAWHQLQRLQEEHRLEQEVGSADWWVAVGFMHELHCLSRMLRTTTPIPPTNTTYPNICTQRLAKEAGALKFQTIWRAYLARKLVKTW